MTAAARMTWAPGEIEITRPGEPAPSLSAQALGLAFPDVPGFKGQGWSTQETVMVVRWLFATPAAWERAMDTARKYPENSHTVADTLHEHIVPRSELDAIVTAGGDPAKVNWLEIAHELIERRDDPHPAAVSLAAQARGGTITAQLDLAAWEHELRDGRGRWVKDPATAPRAASGTQAQLPLDMAEKKQLADKWANSYRYSGRYMSSDDKQRGQDFASELHRLLSENKPPATCGPGCQDAHKFLAMVDQDATRHDAVLSRGVGLDPADAERIFQPGAVVDMPVAAWTADQSQAREFARMSSMKPGYVKVIMHTAPGARGMDLAPVSSGAISMDEQEVVTGGRYSVDKVQTVDGVTHVYVTQQGFSAN